MALSNPSSSPINASAIIANLPEDIRRLLPKYIRKPQPANLLNDIMNFQKTLASAITLFYYCCERDNAPGEYLNWLANDICRYINDDMAYMWGFDQRYYDITMRAWQVKTKAAAQNFYWRLDNSEPINEIRAYWGLMKPEERLDFINISFINMLTTPIEYNFL